MIYLFLIILIVLCIVAVWRIKKMSWFNEKIMTGEILSKHQENNMMMSFRGMNAYSKEQVRYFIYVLNDKNEKEICEVNRSIYSRAIIGKTINVIKKYGIFTHRYYKNNYRF